MFTCVGNVLRTKTSASSKTGQLETLRSEVSIVQSENRGKRSPETEMQANMKGPMAQKRNRTPARRFRRATKRRFKMATFKQIYRSAGAFGGVSYRATSDGETVNLQARPGSTWQIKASITQAEFDKFAEDQGIFDSCNQNPAHLAHLIEEVTH